MAIHKNLTGDEAVHQAAFVQPTDPGAIGAYKFWTDTSLTPPILKLRNGTNNGWISLGAARAATEQFGGLQVNNDLHVGGQAYFAGSAFVTGRVEAGDGVRFSDGTTQTTAATNGGSNALASATSNGLMSAAQFTQLAGANEYGGPAQGNHLVRYTFDGKILGRAIEPFKGDLSNDPDYVAGDPSWTAAKGAVPAPAVGDASAGKFLSSYGDWRVPGGVSGSGQAGYVARWSAANTLEKSLISEAGGIVRFGNGLGNNVVDGYLYLSDLYSRRVQSRGGKYQLDETNKALGLASDMKVKWTADLADPYTNVDVAIGRRANGAVEVNNGTAGALRDVFLRRLTFADSTFLETANVLPGGTTGGVGGSPANILELVGVADCKVLTDVTVRRNSSLVTSAGTTFNSGDVGKLVDLSEVLASVLGTDGVANFDNAVGYIHAIDSADTTNHTVVVYWQDGVTPLSIILRGDSAIATLTNVTMTYGTDNAAAFRSQIAGLANIVANKRAVSIRLPAGNYAVSRLGCNKENIINTPYGNVPAITYEGILNLPSNCRLYGDGMGVSILTLLGHSRSGAKNMGNPGSSVNFRGDWVSNTNNYIQGDAVKFNGNTYVALTATVGQNIDPSLAANNESWGLLLGNVAVLYISDNVHDVTIENLTVRGTNLSAAEMYVIQQSGVFAPQGVPGTNAYSFGIRYGVGLVKQENVRVRNVEAAYFYGMGGRNDGDQENSSLEPSQINFVMDGCHFHHNGDNGLNVAWCGGTQISNSRFEFNGAGGLEMTTSRLIFFGNHVNNNRNVGVAFGGVGNPSVIQAISCYGNFFYRNGAYRTSETPVTLYGTGAGMQLGGNAIIVDIAGNFFFENLATGISAAQGAADFSSADRLFTLRGNKIWNNGNIGLSAGIDGMILDSNEVFSENPYVISTITGNGTSNVAWTAKEPFTRDMRGGKLRLGGTVDVFGVQDGGTVYNIISIDPVAQTMVVDANVPSATADAIIGGKYSQFTGIQIGGHNIQSINNYSHGHGARDVLCDGLSLRLVNPYVGMGIQVEMAYDGVGGGIGGFRCMQVGTTLTWTGGRRGFPNKTQAPRLTKILVGGLPFYIDTIDDPPSGVLSINNNGTLTRVSGDNFNKAWDSFQDFLITIGGVNYPIVSVATDGQSMTVNIAQATGLTPRGTGNVKWKLFRVANVVHTTAGLPASYWAWTNGTLTVSGANGIYTPANGSGPTALSGLTGGVLQIGTGFYKVTSAATGVGAIAGTITIENPPVAGNYAASMSELPFIIPASFQYGDGSIHTVPPKVTGDNTPTLKVIDGTSYTLDLEDANSVLIFTNASAVTLSVPHGLPKAFYTTLKQKGAGQVTISPSAGVTAEAYGGHTSTAGQFAIATLIFEADNVYSLGGQTV